MRKSYIFQIAVFLFGMAVVSGLYTFAVIPKIRADEEKKYIQALENEKSGYIPVLIYTGKTPLAEGAMITEAVEAHFTIMQMPPFCAAADVLHTFLQAEGKQLKYTLVPGQQITQGMLQTFSEEPDQNSRLKEFRLSGLVAGNAMPGHYVDILVVYPDGSYDIVVPKIRIYDICRNASAEETGYYPDGDGLYTVLLAVNEEEYFYLTAAAGQGALDMRLYLHADQEASKRTFMIQ